MSLLDILREPILAETRANLARSRARVPVALLGPRQMLGRGGNGCGATMGAMPRCDFACRSCYLGEDANRTPPASVEAIKAQMRALQPTLGNGGNLQLTDGEVTLRPVEELLDLLRYAQKLRLIPMLMTHGDTFRRRPGLLERLMLEGGLAELSIHIDVTQRGRLGERHRRARTEEELLPLRKEFVTLIRGVTRRTGRPLRVATTMTVTRDNLKGVPAVMRWLEDNTDVFRLISFQPVAQVGRTQRQLGGTVSVEALWSAIAEGLLGRADERAILEEGQMFLGHPACSRYLPGFVLRDGRRTAYHPLRLESDPIRTRYVDGFLDRFGGVTFRLDGPLERLTRVIALAIREPRFVLSGVVPFLRHWCGLLGPGEPLRTAWRILSGRASITPLVIVSHHFMSRAQIETPLGQERLDLCVFHVPVNGTLVPMCQVNAMGERERYYEILKTSLRRHE